MSSHTAHIEQANQVLVVNGDLDAVDVFFAPDFVAHLTGQDMRGVAGVRRFLKLLANAFSDAEVDVEILVEAGDRVAWQRTVRAVHRGAFRGFPATGKPIVWRDMITSRFDADGRFVEDWSISDLAEQLLSARKTR